MANLTLSIDDKLLQAARVRAVHEGTSVNEICRQAIENYARAANADRLRRFDELMASIDAAQRDVQPVEVPWKNRAEMYEHIIAERHPTLMKRGKGKA
ncbi:hypothetical protein [Ramlibacter albus]|uniref:Uncharacterized protein n=1 Tax=Ramlibacter albus TaxID=2079448 RepID=A0A923MBE3_9BURK|nr:hypothetical protein [Ramlibacter albus]MBC5767712.1 hypothetical protein [Ramlibacter albus]